MLEESWRQYSPVSMCDTIDRCSRAVGIYCGLSMNEGWQCVGLTSFREAFGIRRGEVIGLVGGGGKTSLMFVLARELAAKDVLVVTTTTTRMFEPLSSQTDALHLASSEEEMVRWLIRETAGCRHVTVAREKLASGKLTGISPEWVDRMAALRQVSCVIVEADGAAHKSLKAPNATEPVIPASTSLVIPVVGIDALSCRLTAEDVFRPEIVSALLGIPLGEVISAESIATLVTSERGLARRSPARARIVPFINKVDLDDGLSKARQLAALILAKRHPRISLVVLGQAAAPEPALAVIVRRRATDARAAANTV